MSAKTGATAETKAVSGILGFDEITHGGLPAGRVTVVLGAAGCGKTIFALQSLAAGASRGEAGIFVTFEENPAQVLSDASHFDWYPKALSSPRVSFLDGQLSEAIVQGGEFDVLGLLAAVGAAAERLRAKRVVFDGIDMLLEHLGDVALVRREIFRLRAWAYRTGLTCILTAKTVARDDRPTPEYGFLQFVADCVVALDHRVTQGAAIRTLRVAKYRGGAHSSNEFPFTITQRGVEVAGGTSAVMHHAVSTERVSTGIDRLDAMLGGGYYRGSSILISGAPGTSKTSLAASFAAAACGRRERTAYVSFDEAPEQIVRNIASIGIDLGRHAKSGLLAMCSLRARSDNPESHVARIRALLHAHDARNLVVDPLSALTQTCDPYMADRAAVQVLDVAKDLGLTTLSTSLLANSAPLAKETPIGISTIADTWMHVSYVSMGGERNRALTIVKSRGMKHSNQVRELVLTDTGITLADAYLSGGEVLMGTLRWEKENEERRARRLALSESEVRQKQAEGALAETRARVASARAELELREAELARILVARRVEEEADGFEQQGRASRRGSDVPAHAAPRANGRRRRVRP